MKCPACKTKSCAPVELEANLTVASCGSCGGHWLSHKNYSAWLKQHGDTIPEKPFSEVEFDVNDVQEAKLCPDCGRILLKYKVGHGLDFFVDHCAGCGGVWLDTNEWNALRDKNLHDEIHRIFSTSWQNGIRGDRMAEKLDQVYEQRFGSESYEKIKEMREWLQNHPQKQAIFAFLTDENPYSI